MTHQAKRSFLKNFLALPLGLAGLAALPMAARAGTSEKAGDLASKVDQLLADQYVTNARQDITEILHRYARGWDRLDEAALRSCFFEDSTHQHGGFEGRSHDFITGGLKAVQVNKMMTHIVSNVSIEVMGEKASSECYFLAHHRRPGKTEGTFEDWFIKGRYLDKFENREGVWRIAHRVGLSDFARTFAPADTSMDETPGEQLSGHKPDDALYRLFPELTRGYES